MVVVCTFTPQRHSDGVAENWQMSQMHDAQLFSSSHF
jgi:hypothetical protein